MLFVGKGSKRKFASTKALPPDEKSLHMKILRANLVSDSWVNCLHPNYQYLDPLQYGWKMENGALEPLWYTGSALPNKDELDEQPDDLLDSTEGTHHDMSSDDDSSDDEICGVSDSEINSESDDDE